MHSITWKIGGQAGFGIIASGTMLARAFARIGYHIMATNEYPSLIRGGHNVITVRIATDKFAAMNKDVHILVALNAETVTLHKDELNDDAVVIFDPADREWTSGDFSKYVTLIPVPFKEILNQMKADSIMRNTIAVGATVALLGASLKVLGSVIADQFKKKGEDVISENIKIAAAGFDHIKTKFANVSHVNLDKGNISAKQMILNASEAVGIGAARAGLKFAAIYPMTPINSVITFLADHAKQLKIVYKQPEDEISGINMAIGASLAGVRSMVATSGGGYALMVEGTSLAGILETPVVIDMGMRVGPATGMPTYTEQGELQFIIHAGHGDFPKIVLAPGDAEETYSLTIDAFNLADRYQIPVFVLTDKYLNESQWCVPYAVFKKEVTIDRGKRVKESELPPDGSFKRYNLNTDDGVSPMSLPGMKNGVYDANSYEHDEFGFTTEGGNERMVMADKRLKKFAAMEKDVHGPAVYGDTDAEITFVSWGSMKGPILEAMRILKTQGKQSKLIHFTWMYPFPAVEATKILSSAKRLIDVELNGTGQLATLIREHTGIIIKEKILQYNGRVPYPEEIVEKVK